MKEKIKQHLNTENAAAFIFFIFSLVPLVVSSDYTLNSLSDFYIYTLLCISLSLVWGLCGIFSFAQAAFFGVGAYTYAVVSMNCSFSGNTLVALLAGVVIAAATALVLGYFMFYGRINDVFVGLITLCFTLAVSTFLAQTASSKWTIGKVGLGGYNGISNVPPLTIGSLALNNLSFYVLIVACVFLFYLLIRRMMRRKWGYALLAIRENRGRSALFGYNVPAIQMIVFTCGGAIAGLSGVFYASWGSYVNPNVMDLAPATIPVVLVAAGGRKNITGAMIFAFIYYWISQFLSAGGSQYALVILGLLLILVIEFVPKGLFASLFETVDKKVSLFRKGEENFMSRQDEPLLKVRDLSIRFGGINALSHFDLDVYPGEIHCMIGPNGAGKTTALKLIMGIYKPTSGRIYLEGREITRMPSYKRVRNQMSIKMQMPGVFGDLRLRDNLRIALRHVDSVAKREREMDRLIDLVGIASLRNPIVKYMTHGQQQWLEIAMALASRPKLLLLDEPAAGLGPDETKYTADIIKKLNEQGMTILFIEHDMSFVKQIARKVTVLHQGKKFMEGSVEEVSQNKEVIDIYLGKEHA